MTCTGATATLPIFRPLVGLDKDEITAIAKHAGTFDISIRPYEDCCTVFLPKAPVIHPTLKAVERAEQGMDIEGLVSAAVEGKGAEIFREGAELIREGRHFPGTDQKPPKKRRTRRFFVLFAWISGVGEERTREDAFGSEAD